MRAGAFPARLRRLRAAIFDFDGVLADTEDVHYLTFSQTLAEQGIRVSREEHAQHYMGIDDLGCFELAFRRAGRSPPAPERAQELLARKSRLYDAALRDIRVFPGAVEAFEAARRRGPCTIASCGRRRDIEAVLGHHGLLERVPEFVTADEIARPKPDPDCFLRALGILRRGHPALEPADCLVFEDSVRGVEAARRAGMACVALTHSFPAESLRGADLVIEGWEEWRWG